jgi:hypothetical protein
MFIGRETRLVARVKAAQGRLSFFESFLVMAGGHAAEAEFAAVGQFAHLVLRHGVDRLGQSGVGVHRMAGDVEAEQFLFELQPVAAVSWRSAQGGRGICHRWLWPANARRRRGRAWRGPRRPRLPAARPALARVAQQLGKFEGQPGAVPA